MISRDEASIMYSPIKLNTCNTINSLQNIEPHLGSLHGCLVAITSYNFSQVNSFSLNLLSRLAGLILQGSCNALEKYVCSSRGILLNCGLLPTLHYHYHGRPNNLYNLPSTTYTLFFFFSKLFNTTNHLNITESHKVCGATDAST